MNFKNKLIKFISLGFILPSLCQAGDTVTVNINGSVTASTCDIQTPSLDFDFGQVVVSSVTEFRSISLEKDISFNCPSGLLLQGTLQGTPYSDTDEWKIAATGTAKGFVFLINYISPNGTTASLVFENSTSSSTKWRNLIDATSYGANTTTKTTLGVNTLTIRAILEQVDATTYTAGDLSATVTIGIRYTN